MKMLYDPQTDTHYTATPINGSYIIQTVLSEKALNFLIKNGNFDEIISVELKK